jgi:BirA family biotin operon repressor/biotin-[acetyl-CoA-carboxylase] ligase
MKHIDIVNPFGAPVYYKETVTSTMDEVRLLAADGCPSGTVMVAAFQTGGRGRTAGRAWSSEAGRNLCCTVLLRFGKGAPLPQALTLRVGLAAALAVEAWDPGLSGRVQVKWPNDLILGGNTLAGILTEGIVGGEEASVAIGIGLNVGQRAFPGDLAAKATSLFLAGCRKAAEADAVNGLLEKLLDCLYGEIGVEGAGAGWTERLNVRLYRRGERVRFAPGAADSGKVVEGTISGVSAEGGLVLGEEVYTNGELLF